MNWWSITILYSNNNATNINATFSRGGLIMPQNNNWAEITVVTTSEAVEAVSAIFYDIGVPGVAIEDPKDILNSNTRPGEWDYIEERLLPDDTSEVKIKGYLPFISDIQCKLQYIRSAVSRLGEYGLDKGAGDVTVREVHEQDWANAWKKYYKPLKIGKHIVIKPTWEDYNGLPGDIVIDLDPGMAFGTGTHETTMMCIELLEEYIRENSIVFDIGCGSGILSIVSSKLGASKIIGVDIDEVAVKVSNDNVKISNANNVEIIHGNLLDVITGKADIIVANIIADAIIGLAGKLHQVLAPGGVFIASGIIRERSTDVTEALIQNGFTLLKVDEMGEWVAIASTIKEQYHA